MADDVRSEKMTDEDHKIVSVQLGREPRGVIGVVVRCVYGYPQVIMNRPVRTEIEDVKVFPTLFWLTCPFLKREVGHLESEGWIGKFQDKIASDPDFAAQLANNHQTHAKARSALVPDDVKVQLEKSYPKRYKVLCESGVGGSRQDVGVKCLHTHLADYLARGENVIGCQVLDLLSGQRHCFSGECSKEATDES